MCTHLDDVAQPVKQVGGHAVSIQPEELQQEEGEAVQTQAMMASVSKSGWGGGLGCMWCQNSQAST
jgi:hypothetical protein